MAESPVKPKKFKLTAQIVEGFVGSCLTPYFDDPVPFQEFHREWWNLCCSDEQFVAICAPRRHSKSTTVTISYGLATVLFRERKFVVIVADTEAQAVLFLAQMKRILYDSMEIRELFDLETNEKGEIYFEKDTETDVIVRFKDGSNFRIMAKGAEQKLRGLLHDGSRPDLLLIDDLMNEELVANKDRRDKLRRWFYGALVPCRSKNGIIRFLGTPMNLDDPLESLMPKDSAKDTTVEDLKIWSKKKKGMWKAVKYRAHNSDFSQILWPEMWPEQKLKELRNEMSEQGIPEVYSCEMLCNPVDDSIRYFRKTDMLPMVQDDFKKKLSYYITVDLAISERDRADYSAFVITGMDENGVLYVRNVIRDRMAGDEIVETLLTLQKVYDPIAIGIEDTQISKSLGPFLNRTMMERGTYINIIPLKPHRTDKISRARSIQARMRAAAVKFDKAAEWWPTFEDEVLSFPRAKHDDMVDALSYIGILIDRLVEAPTIQETEDEEYEHELEESGEALNGKNEVTGY